LGRGHEPAEKSGASSFAIADKVIINNASTSRPGWISKNDDQQRIYPRVATPIRFTYKLVRKLSADSSTVIDYSGEYSALTNNLSAGGLCFTSNDPVEVGAILDLQLPMGDAFGEGIRCLARVCRADSPLKSDVSGKQVCVYFLDISSQDRRAVSQHIDAILKSENNPVPS
ncbi:MAG: PilZ domain-containing protein, partial [Candidatus Omnitrophica bacterium]|nr:PilZ domain-containing protein [Candidatus Omnitrophota bacterium]